MLIRPHPHHVTDGLLLALLWVLPLAVEHWAHGWPWITTALAKKSLSCSTASSGGLSDLIEGLGTSQHFICLPHSLKPKKRAGVHIYSAITHGYKDNVVSFSIIFPISLLGGDLGLLVNNRFFWFKQYLWG